MFYFSAILLGLISSVHCLGMCGPISLAIPRVKRGRYTIIFEALIFHSGRIFIYALLGFLIGFLGFGLQFLGMQKAISIGIGLLLLTFAILPKLLYKLEFYNPIKTRVQNILIKNLKPKNQITLFFLGNLNGLLPCGVVYMAMLIALNAQTNLEASLFMAFFGLGNLPPLFIIYILKNNISLNFRKKLNSLIPYSFAFLGFLLILRGFELGIPIISPKYDIIKLKTEVICNLY